MHNIGYLSVSDGCDRGAVIADIEDEAFRCGDGYSGPLKWHDEVKPLKNRDEAERWIKDHDKGWYDDHAVRYYAYGQAQTKRADEIRARIAELARKRNEYVKQHSVRVRKAEYVSCPECGSRLKRELLNGDFCPLCRSDMRAQTTVDTIKRYDDRRNELQEALKREDEKGRGDVRWLVKYEYHS